MENSHQPQATRTLQPAQNRREPKWHPTPAITVVYVMQQDRGILFQPLALSNRTKRGEKSITLLSFCRVGRRGGNERRLKTMIFFQPSRQRLRVIADSVAAARRAGNDLENRAVFIHAMIRPRSDLTN